MPPESIEFRTPPVERWFDALVGAAGGGALAPLSIFIPLGFALFFVEEFNISPSIAAAVALPICALGLRLAWAVAAFRLRGRVIFHENYLQIGVGWFALFAAYDEVQEILWPVAREGSWLKLRIGGKFVRVVLTTDDLRQALQLLAERCPNAVHVDGEGGEHLSLRNNNAASTTLVLERRRWQLAFGMALAALFFAVLFCGRAFVLWQWRRGNLQLAMWEQAWIVADVLLRAIAAFVLAASGINFARQARALRKQRLAPEPHLASTIQACGSHSGDA